jgi:hypothetical protein
MTAKKKSERSDTDITLRTQRRRKGLKRDAGEKEGSGRKASRNPEAHSRGPMQ